MIQVISTFSGCGGSSLGYKLAGAKVRLAIEWDDNAVAIYRLNFPLTPIFHDDIAKLTVDEGWKLSGLKPGELDILDGSPPCQGFSTAGKRQFGDKRNQLFREYTRLLQGFMPRAFVMENVSGMVIGKMKMIFAECLRELKVSGYKVKARLLNTMYFNVPQSRLRLIFIGIRDDLGVEPSYPRAQAKPVTVKQVLGCLPSQKSVSKHEPQTIRSWHRAKPGYSLRTTTPHVGSFQSYRLHPNRPAPVQISSQRHWHYDVARKLTDLEAALLSSFPASYQWTGTKGSITQCIGNSVPPNFMRAIAEHVIGLITGPRDG